MRMTEAFPVHKAHVANDSPLAPRVLVITSCTGEKRSKPSNPLTIEDFKNDSRLQERVCSLAEEFTCPAGEMYTGLQHLRTMEGVELLRQSLGCQAVDLMILSAGYGLIPEDKPIVPYEVTFSTMKGYEVDEWAKHLGIHEAVEEAIKGYDLVFMLLGDNYLRSLRLPITTRDNQTFIFLTSKLSANYVRGIEAKTFILPLSNAEAKRYRYGLVGLKGFLFKQFAQIAAQRPEVLELLVANPEVFTQFITTESTQMELPLELPPVQVKANLAKEKNNQSEKIFFLPIPDQPPAPNLHLKMQYFIPEWDDRVDPGYKFLTDTLKEKRDPYEDVYAHEIFPTPNYDGILVSRVVIDKSKKKKERIYELGVRKFIRFSGPLMGDCGAFGYIKEDVPPYTTDEILEYYHQLDFDYGVSIDHLIVGPFADIGVREKRYDITLKNAGLFIQKYREGGYQFTPIGVAQGWSPESYAEAVKTIIGMGYDYVALGGLARERSPKILEILQAICPHLTPNTRLHLFGVGRINAVPAFRHLGVTSFDSASPLRSAWLDSSANYHTLTGRTYTAARIPQVEKSSLRIKRLIDAGVSDREELKQLEQKSLHAIREFDAGRLSLEETLQILLNYDELLELPRNGKVDLSERDKRQIKHIEMYRQLLEGQPWKSCDCEICKNIGVEVAIFRGNDRNRRRGFHNTYIFYKRFQEILLKYGNDFNRSADFSLD